MFNRSATSAAASQMQPTPPAPPAPPAAQQPAPAPPTAAAPEPRFWISINGAQPQLMTASQARALPPTTSAMREGQENAGWSTLAAFMPAGAAPAPAPGLPQQRPPAAGGFNRPAQQQQQQQQQPAQYAGTPQGLFAGVNSAAITRRGQNYTPGEYVIKVLNAEYKKARNGDFVLMETEIVVSSYDEKIPDTHQTLRVGAHATIFVKKNDSFASNMKEIVHALSGFDANGNEREETGGGYEEDAEGLISQAQPFAGVLAYVEAREVPTRAGGLFTRISWWPCPLLSPGVPDLDKIASR